MTAKSNQESVKKYQQTRDAIMLRPSKKDGQTIRYAAKAAGMSVQAFVLKAALETVAAQGLTEDRDARGRELQELMRKAYGTQAWADTWNDLEDWERQWLMDHGEGNTGK